MAKKPTPKEEAERLFREMKQEFARKGGTSRAEKLTPARKTAIAKKAAAARWKRK